VGGGIVIDDMVLEGEHSHGAELGHMIIEMTEPRQCGCGRMGCLEAYASATAVVKRALEGMQGVTYSCLSSYCKKPDDLTARIIFEAAEAGDRFADQIVEETAYYLAVGTTNMLHCIDPDMVVFGGGMTAAGSGFLSRIQRHVKRLAFPVPAEKCRLTLAQLGSDAGFIGAAACGRLLLRKNQANQVSKFETPGSP
jgi:glucokinase